MLSVVLVAQGGFDSLFLPLDRLGDAVDELEARGVATETVLVAQAGDPELLALMDAIVGAEKVVVAPGTSWVEMWLAGAAAAAGEVLWLACSESRYGESEASAALRCLRRSDAVFGSGHALMRRDALEAAAPRWRREGEVSTTRALRFLKDAIAEVDRRAITTLEIPTVVSAHGMDAALCTFGPGSITIGRHSYAGDTSVIRAFPWGDVRIGAFCSISQHVLISNHAGTGVRLLDQAGRPLPARLTKIRGHHPETATTYPLAIAIDPPPDFYEEPGPGSVCSRPLEIGNDVWVGVGAMVLGGVSVGDGAVIGSGAVVLDDVPPYAVVLGNPAKVVRMRFSAAIIERLHRIRWWDWSDQEIAAEAEWFTRPIGEFVGRFDPPRAAPSDLAVAGPGQIAH